MDWFFLALLKDKSQIMVLYSDKIIDIALGGRFTGSETYIAPLYIYNTNGNYDQNGNGFLFKDKEKKDNFTKEFRLF